MKFSPAVTIFLSLALSFCMSSISFGQNCRLSIGPSASVDHYWGAGSNNIAGQVFENRTKYSVGVGAYFKLSDRFILKSGLLHSRKGSKQMLDPAKLPNPHFITYRERESKANHLDMPLLVGYRIAKAGNWSLVPAAGIITSVKISETTTITRLDKSIETITLSPSFSRIAWGLTAEIGLNYQATETLQIGISPYWRAMAWGYDPGPHYYGALLELRFGF